MKINKKVLAIALSAVMVAAPVSQVGQCFAADESAISQVVNIAENKLIDENSNESGIILEADKSQEVVADEKVSSEDKAIEKVTVKKSKKEMLKNFWNKYQKPIKIAGSVLGGALAAYLGYKGAGAIKGTITKPAVLDSTNTTIPVKPKEVKIEAPVVNQPIITDGNNSTIISNSSTYDANINEVQNLVIEQEEQIEEKQLEKETQKVEEQIEEEQVETEKDQAKEQVQPGQLQGSNPVDQKFNNLNNTLVYKWSKNIVDFTNKSEKAFDKTWDKLFEGKSKTAENVATGALMIVLAGIVSITPCCRVGK